MYQVSCFITKCTNLPVSKAYTVAVIEATVNEAHHVVSAHMPNKISKPIPAQYLTTSIQVTWGPVLSQQTPSINRMDGMAAGSRLQVQSWIFFFFHLLFKHTLCS